MTKLSRSFYTNPNTTEVARSLLGKVLFTRINNHTTSGIIIETEAYLGIRDQASHAFGGRRTKRTESMYAIGGQSYVYLCYGIHHLFNVVTGPENDPQAVLIRNILPHQGIDLMMERRSRDSFKNLSTGPGTTSQALGITLKHDRVSLLEDQIWIEDLGFNVEGKYIEVSPRIGIEYAGKDALLPYRYLLRKEYIQG